MIRDLFVLVGAWDREAPKVQETMPFKANRIYDEHMKKSRKKPNLIEPLSSNLTDTNGYLIDSTHPMNQVSNLSNSELGIEPHTQKFIWVEVAPDARQPNESDLDWTRETLKKHFDLTIFQVVGWSSAAAEFLEWYSTQSWAQDSVSHTSRGQGKANTFDSSSSSSPIPISKRLSTSDNHILIASSFRSDAIENFSQSIRAMHPTLKQSFVLGQWWSGHKRTAPFSKETLAEVTIYYWYQVYDRILGEMVSQKPTEESSPLSSAPQTIPYASALVYSHNPDLRKLFVESLPLFGVHTVGVYDLDSTPDSAFTYILIDCDLGSGVLEPAHGDESLEPHVSEKIRTLRKRYPNAIIAAFFGFPEWQETQRTLQAGADLIFGKPCEWSSMLKSLLNASKQSTAV